MKKFSKKVKILLGITTFLAIIVALIILYLNNHSSRTDRILFQYSYTNYAWAPTSRGYYIYSNGIIKEYDDYNEDKELKSAQTTKEELNQLKELANKVEDKYEKEDSGWCDAGTSTKQIYSSRLSKWIMLSQMGDAMGNNSTEAGKEIINLTNELCDKYLTADDGTNWIQSNDKLFEMFN